jgi:hypothetical protein
LRGNEAGFAHVGRERVEKRTQIGKKSRLTEGVFHRQGGFSAREGRISAREGTIFYKSGLVVRL